jgi:hypothetical protein
LTLGVRYLAGLFAVTLFAVAPALGWEHRVDGAAAWPLAARAQPAMSVISSMSSGSADES